MTSPVETTAAMTPPAEQRESAGPADAPVSGAGGIAGSALESALEAVGSVPSDFGEPAAKRQELSLNFVVTLFGGAVTVLLGALIGLMMWQFSSLGARVDANGARIDRLGTELRAEMRDEISGLRGQMGAEIGGLRAEMSGLRGQLRDEISGLRTELRAEISDVRTEMQAGFAEIQAVLLDHTDRLARLEAAAGLPRIEQ